jgi:sialate O-acetylesterase
MKKLFLLFCLCISLLLPAQISKITLSNVFSSNMVLQQDVQTSLWGWAAANDSVEITASWGERVKVQTGTDNRWIAKIQTPKAIHGIAPKYTLTFKGSTNTVVLSNILIGDVWICSGQSNMGYYMTPNLPYTRGVPNYTTEIAAANYPNIRLFTVGSNPQTKPVDNCTGSWLECNPTNVAYFSAVAYFFGRELYQNSNINIPIGLLVTTYGGSACEAWTSREALAANETLKTTYLDPYDASPTTIGATTLYNGMIAPLIPFSFKGTIWYQGEANASNGTDYYKTLCSAMLHDWRAKWGLGNFPFYFVQLQVYTNTLWPAFRDAQTSMLTDLNTGMAVTIDLVDPDPTNVHPMNKYEVGQRLALWATAKTYGQDITYSGPVYKSCTIQGNKMIISFHPATLGSGLMSKDGRALTEFKIAGANNVFYAADALIDGNTIVVSSPSVPSPTIVSYAYSANPVPNFINKEGLPAAPFKTDTWNFNIDFTTGVNNVNAENELIISNPVKNTLIVSALTTIKSIDVYDISGKRVMTKNATNATKIEINMNTLKNGIYLLKIRQSDGRETTRKFIGI